MRRLKASLMVLVLLVSICVFFSNLNTVFAFPLLFESDFETAGLPEWDYAVYYELVTDPVFSGLYSCNATSSSFQLWENLTGTQSMLYVRFYVRWRGLAGTTPRGVLQVKSKTLPTDIIYIYTDDSGADKLLYVYTNDLGQHWGTTPLQNDTWYCLELRAEVAASANITLWLDGDIESRLAGTMTKPTR